MDQQDKGAKVVFPDLEDEKEQQKFVKHTSAMADVMLKAVNTYVCEQGGLNDNSIDASMLGAASYIVAHYLAARMNDERAEAVTGALMGMFHLNRPEYFQADDNEVDPQPTQPPKPTKRLLN